MEKNMKKKLGVALLTMMLVFCLCLGLSACEPADNQDSKQDVPAISISTEPITITVRTEVATITDSGRASQKMDIVFLSNYFDAEEAYNAGYTKLHVTLTLEAREIDDGYQYVFLYADKNCKSNTFFDKIIDEFYDPEDPSLLYEYRFEHDANGKDTNWGTHTFTATLKMNRLIDDLYIRYGASGSYADDWQNRNIVITFQVGK